MLHTDKTPSELEEAARNQGPASSVKYGLSELIGGGENADADLETPAPSQAGVVPLANSTHQKKSRTDDAATRRTLRKEIQLRLLVMEATRGSPPMRSKSRTRRWRAATRRCNCPMARRSTSLGKNLMMRSRAN